MTQSVVSVGIFIVLLACVPTALKWYRHRTLHDSDSLDGQSRFISALAVGPHQRVVTVEVGPKGHRVWLTLGVTPQEISCLHCVEVTGEPGELGQDALGLVSPASHAAEVSAT